MWCFTLPFNPVSCQLTGYSNKKDTNSGCCYYRAAEYLVRTGPTATLEVAKQGAIYHGLATLLQQPSPVMGRGKANNVTCYSYCTVLRVLKRRGFMLRACRNYSARNIDAFALYIYIYICPENWFVSGFAFIWVRLSQITGHLYVCLCPCCEQCF